MGDTIYINKFTIIMLLVVDSESFHDSWYPLQLSPEHFPCHFLI